MDKLVGAATGQMNGEEVTSEFTGSCGTCRHGRLAPGNFQMRICFGMPPQIIIGPGPNGQLAIQNGRPVLPMNEPSCSLYEKRSGVLNIAQNSAGKNPPVDG